MSVPKRHSLGPSPRRLSHMYRCLLPEVLIFIKMTLRCYPACPPSYSPAARAVRTECYRGTLLVRKTPLTGTLR